MQHLNNQNISEFLTHALPGAERALACLAVAESLTDQVAGALYSLANVEGVSAELFLDSLHQSEMTAARNSEWHIVPSVRQNMYRIIQADQVLFAKANEYLLDLARSGDPLQAGTKLPSYLFTESGVAYHELALKIESALSRYTSVFRGVSSADQWLGATLSTFQQEAGLISESAVEPTFMRGMVEYREGRVKQAITLLERVSETRLRRWEVAVAHHLVGIAVGRIDPARATDLFEESLSIGEEIGDIGHQLHVLNSQGTLIYRFDRKAGVLTFERGLEMARAVRDARSTAVFLGTLGNALVRTQPERAELLLSECIDLARQLGDQRGEAIALHSLSRLRRNTRPNAALLDVQRSIAIGRALKDNAHLAQTLRTYGLIVLHQDASEAEKAFIESVQINRRLGNNLGEALAMRSLADMYLEADRMPEAAQMYDNLAKLLNRSDTSTKNYQTRQSTPVSNSINDESPLSQIEDEQEPSFR